MQQFQQQTSNNSYAQIVSNVNSKDNPYTANMPQIPQSVHQQQVAAEQDVALEGPKRTVKKSLHSLAAAYGSGSESENEDDEEDEEVEAAYKKPTGELQVIIDKMASYVSKNGEQFEEIVKAKADPRFDFLHDNNEFNRYYREKIKEIKGEKTEEIGEKNDSDGDEKNKKEECEAKVAKKEKKVIAPVSFSIKKAKDDAPKEIKSALPMEDSDEDVEENSAPTQPVNPALPSLVASLKQIVGYKKNDRSSTSESKSSEVKNQEKSVKSVVPENKQSNSKVEKPLIKQPDTKNMEKEGQEVKEQSKKPDVKKIDKIPTDENSTIEMDREKTKRKGSRSNEMSSKKNGILDEDDPILEVMELTGEDIEANSDKIAEEKRRDKLAVAKEKLNAVSRLQLERKRKAAAFLKLMSAETTLHTKHQSPERQRTPLRRSSSEVVEHTVEGNRCGASESHSEASRYKLLLLLFKDF
nr:unnamed protein product [Callosobruchus analis]